MQHITNDAVEAASLVMHGGRLSRIEPRPDRPDYCLFFIETDEDAVFNYQAGNLLVVPSLFMAKYRALVAAAQRIARQR